MPKGIGYGKKGKKKEKKDKKDKKKKPAKKLIPNKSGGFDPAHPASTTLMARKQARDAKRKK